LQELRANSTQNLTRPGFGPAAEPPRQHPRLAGGTPADILSRRYRGANVAAVAPRRGNTWALAAQVSVKR